MKKFFVLLVSFLSFFSFNLVASANATLTIHFYYDVAKSTLSFDDNFSPVISLDKHKNIYITEFESSYTFPGKYELVFLDSNDEIIDSVQFAPTAGSFTIDAPDFNITKTIAVRDTGSREFFLKKDISQYISCNNNRICEYEKGETEISCIPDCGNSQISYSAQTLSTISQNGGRIIDSVSGATVLRDRRKEQLGDSGAVITPVVVPTNTTPANGNTTGQSNTSVSGVNNGNQIPTHTDNQQTGGFPWKNQTILLVASGFLCVILALFFLFRSLRTKD